MILKVSSGKSAAVMLRYCAEKERGNETGNKIERSTAESNSLGCKTTQEIRDAWALTRQSWNKDDGIRYHHASLSLDPKDHRAREITDKELLAMGEKFADNWAPGHDYAVYVHRDKQHPHVHIVMNSVNAETGIKLHKTPQDLERGFQIKDELSRDYGLRVVEHERQHEPDRVSGNAARLVERNPDAYLWTEDLKSCITVAKENASSFEDFQARIKEAGVTANPRGREGEITYSFHDENDKQRKCREANLGTDYGRKSIEWACGENQKRLAMEADTAHRGKLEEWRKDPKAESTSETRGTHGERDRNSEAEEFRGTHHGDSRGEQALVFDFANLGSDSHRRAEETRGESLSGLRARIQEIRGNLERGVGKLKDGLEHIRERIGEFKKELAERFTRIKGQFEEVRMPTTGTKAEAESKTTRSPIVAKEETATSNTRLPHGHKDTKKEPEIDKPKPKRQIEME